VIVLAGADAKDDSLRRFAATLVDRPGSRILVWTHDDVLALAAGEPTVDAVAAAAASAATATPAAEPAPVRQGADSVVHTGRYRPLWEWLRSNERREMPMSFTDVERAIGIPLPESCRDHVAHWHSYQGSAVARAIIDAGWHASGVDVTAGMVTLSPGPPPRRR
jgi:hypothetical protein